MSERRLCVALIHGQSCGSFDLKQHLPAGHSLSRARRRCLGESEWIVVSQATVPRGFAAFRRADGEVRVVHEFFLDPCLSPCDAFTVTDAVLSTLEMVALEDGVTCLTFLLRNGVVIAPFERRGYMSLALGPTGVWLQRKLGWTGWSGSAMQH